VSVTTWGDEGIYGTWTATGEAIPELLRMRDWPSVVAAHNGKYDQLWSHEQYGIVPPVTWDTMLAEHLIDSEGPKGLKILGAKYLHVPDWSIDLRDPETIPLGVLAEYAATDTAVTAEICRRQQPHERLLKDLLMPASSALLGAEIEGVGLDLGGARELRTELVRQARGLTERISVHGPADTPGQVGKLLYEILGLPVLERTGTGRPRVAGAVLRRLDHPVADMIADRAKVQKGISAFLTPWIESVDPRQPRLYSTFRIAGTATGRLSSGGAEGASGINLQQIPRDPRYKRLIQARPGYTLAELDYSQIELRVAAHLSGDPRMLDIYRTGGDIHTTTAKAVTGKQLVDKSDRTKAKAVNFGFLYGMGAASFRDYARDSYGVELTEEEAADYRKRFFELYAGLPEWHRRTKEEAARNRCVETLFGRVRYLDGIEYWSGSSGGAALRQAVNTSVQSVASDMMILALGLIDRLIVNSDEYDAKIIATVHDSVLLEVKEEGAEDVARKVKYIMEHLPLKHFGVTMDVPIEAGLAMGDRWGEMEEI
jgi:DNA polymerase-1